MELKMIERRYKIRLRRKRVVFIIQVTILAVMAIALLVLCIRAI